MRALRIKDWDRDRENADTRKYVNLIWFRSTVKLLGEGLGHTLGQPDRQGPFLYGMFKLIEQIAASGKLGERGWLVRNGTAMDAARMANLMRLPAAYFEEAVNFFTTAPMDWLEWGEFPDKRENTGRTLGDSPGNLPPSEDEQDAAGRNAPSEERPKIKKDRYVQKEKENGGFASKDEARRAQAQQFAALQGRLSRLEATPEDERTEAEAAEIKKTRRDLKAVQKKQANGDFTPLEGGAA